jgi:glucose-1-phosphate thymidylyltransferase
VRDTVAGDAVRIVRSTVHDSFLGDRVVVDGVSGRMTLGDDADVRGDA